MQRLVNDAYDTCKKLLSENRALMDTMVQKLLTDENIDYDELNKMRDAHYAKMSGAVLEPVA